ncbi:MAG TPA: ABC transporter substrate-binding protein, partial [Candidatus Binatia bacterium]|nr:ABC transporter substrate-binding protein [Candidatus Binatia bacterium]
KGEEYAIDYKLHEVNGSWKIYDAIIENVSLVNNYRSQFNRVIAKSSYEDLMTKMKDKQFEAPGKKAKT